MTDFSELLSAADRLSVPGRRRILGVTGPPGAGKSTLAQRLVDTLGPDRAVLVGMDGAAVPLRNVTLDVQETRLSGHGPCNGYTATNSAELPALALSQLNTTLVACGKETFEQRFFQVLQSSTEVEYYGGVLKVKSPATWLIFERGHTENSGVNALEAARAQQN